MKLDTIEGAYSTYSGNKSNMIGKAAGFAFGLFAGPEFRGGKEDANQSLVAAPEVTTGMIKTNDKVIISGEVKDQARDAATLARKAGAKQEAGGLMPAWFGEKVKRADKGGREV